MKCSEEPHIHNCWRCKGSFWHEHGHFVKMRTRHRWICNRCFKPKKVRR